MTFFPAAEPLPAWPWSPPLNRIPVPVAWHVVLVRTSDTAVAVTNVSAAPEGVLLSLVTRLRPVDGDPDGPLDAPPSGLRFGVRLPDGSQAFNDEAARDVQRQPPPPGHHLSCLGGQGGGTFMQEDYWLWPLPGRGTVAFACQWPGRGVPETVREMDTAPLLEAAGRSDELWSLPPLLR
jgi:hypothetical protein